MACFDVNAFLEVRRNFPQLANVRIYPAQEHAVSVAFREGLVTVRWRRVLEMIA